MSTARAYLLEDLATEMLKTNRPEGTSLRQAGILDNGEQVRLALREDHASQMPWAQNLLYAGDSDD
jgi:hypothetical protein